MSNTEIQKIIKETSRLIDTKLFALVFVRIRILLKELQQWWAISRCDELEGLFSQMLHYALGDYYDPDRSRIVAQLQDDLYLLLDDIQDALYAKLSVTYDYQQRRIENISTIDWKTITDVLQLTDATYTEQKTETLSCAFRSVWLESRISGERYNQLIAFFSDPSIETTAQQMLLSALMLKGLRVYDAAVVSILIEQSRASEPRLRARAVVGLLMILSHFSSRVARDSKLSSKLQNLFADDTFIADIERAYKHIINTFGTDKVTKKITTEIYPEIFKSGAKLQQILQDEGADPLNDEEFNPKWEKALMDDEGVSAKLREFGDMQQQGADVYMSTFSSMKGYTFFNNIAHWFMPFDVKQIDVARQMSDMPDLLRFFAESTHICSSDKYSFFYSIAQIPAANFKSMMSGMGADAEAIREDIDSENWKQNNHNIYAVELRNYVLDIFRFYRLYPRRADFVNPFNSIDKFDKNTFVFSLLPQELKKSICKYLFEVEHFLEALPLFEYLDAQQVWDAYFYQQMGYCYQQLTRWREALDCYEKADLLEADDIWTLKRKALCYRELNLNDQLVNCYEVILRLKDDDFVTMLNYANYHLSVSDYDRARALYHKVEYLRPNNYKAQSGIAQCAFLLADYDKAMTYYDRLSQHKDFSIDDAFFAGHTFWALQAKDIARDYYRRAKSLLDNDIKFAEKMIAHASYLQALGLSDEDIVILINQIIM
ncbi:MAG: hypothetical protein J6R43_01230 [Paludibacteraceae bacterium]|nr:hypothetical protein [Paludibacteraceae bacterium]